jgi:3-oxoacyl-[acyl-carrier protein] reductase
MCDKRFAGKTALVTGAGRGMGKATAVTLAAGGAAVAVNDLNQEAAQKVVDEIVAAGGTARAWACDVSDSAAVQKMVKEIVAAFGGIHILVNNAGILRPNRPVETIEDDEWRLVLRVNVDGVFYCTKAVLPYMKAQRYGKILNLSSSAGRTTSTFGGAHYTTSKAAVLGLTRHTARDAAKFNINVNTITPGSIDTEMVREMSTPEIMDKERRNNPLGRLGTAQDAANLIAFLVSDESSYITGATVDLNGGDLMM